MDLQSRTEGGSTILALDGRLDGVTAPEFEKRIRALIDGGQTRFVVDFEQLDYISSAGLRALLVMAKLLESKDGRVCLVGVTGNVRSVFDMSRFTDIFHMEDSIEAAIATME